ncbi:hypothetical protein [Chromobacterium vaccinii]|uniref:Uncharacterized protein n=1 Tax=Chromobacterium vaccinii TaxID=1108595 RepID=A0A1D9LDV8_9NEIS|nr:hypothetical protein [Chromobacterium vaccinii]AOZ49459.1 hypothetical protein BKX93_05245 [Chromobacterium vaccinii]
MNTQITAAGQSPAIEQTLRDLARETALMQLTLDDRTALSPGQLVQTGLIHAANNELSLNDPDSYIALLKISARLLIASRNVTCHPMDDQ